MSILRLTGVTREVGTFVILDAIDASIALGDRIGLVGPNGAGKTTLLRLASGRDEPDLGEVHRKRNLTLGLLAQEAHFDEAFMASPDLRQAVRTGAAHLDRMAERLAVMERDGKVTDHAYAELLHQYEILGGYTLDQRVDSALTGLGFTRDEWAKPPSALSGGEQTRASLARLVIADPDLLLLDEPTNHLDLDALEWLEEHLRRRSGSLLVASHDRAFLDATVDRDLGAARPAADGVPRRLQRLPPPARRARRTSRQGCRHTGRADRPREGADPALPEPPQVQQAARARGSARAAGGGAARGTQGEPEAGDPDDRAGRRRRPVTQRRDRGAPRGSGGRLPAGARGDGAGRLDRDRGEDVARAPFLAAQRGERIGIVGPNGAGKTTLLRTIAGDLPPLDGSITFGNAVQIGYLAQLRSAAIAGATVLDALLEAVPVTAGEARAYLARFLFRGDDAFKEVRLLSGGERSRLELALLGIQPSNLLLLDEPTNHLDIPAREAIEAFMAGSPATLLVVSHDRRLLETVCDKLWVVGEGSAVAFDGGYREWRAAVANGWTVERRWRWRRLGAEATAAPSIVRSPVPTALRLTGPVRARPPVRRGPGPRPHHPTGRAVGRRRSCPRRRIGARRRRPRRS